MKLGQSKISTWLDVFSIREKSGLGAIRFKVQNFLGVEEGEIKVWVKWRLNRSETRVNMS